MSYANPSERHPTIQRAAAAPTVRVIRSWWARAAFSIATAACVFGVVWTAERVLREAPEWRVFVEILLSSPVIYLLLHVSRTREARAKEEHARSRREQEQLSMSENRPLSFTAYHAPQGRWYEMNAFPSEQGLAVSFQDITARKKAEEALRQSETGMALAQRVAKFGSWEVELTADHLSLEHPVRWSDEAFKIAGRAPQSFQPTLGDFMRLIHPDDVEWVSEAWAAAVAHRTPYALEHRIILPDGQVRLVQEAAEIFEPAGAGGLPIAVGTARDITEEAHAKEALRASEERFRAVFEQAPVGICEVDGAGNFKRVNRQFREMLGYTQDELLKLGVADVTHTEQRTLCLQLVGEIAAGVRQTYDLEKRFLPRDGGTLWAHLTLTLLQPLTANHVQSWRSCKTLLRGSERKQRWNVPRSNCARSPRGSSGCGKRTGPESRGRSTMSSAKR